MKSLLIHLLLLTTVLMTPSFAMAATAKVHVNGIVCAFCVQGIDNQFKKIDGVKNVDVNLDTKIVTLDIDDAKPLDDDVITKLIQDAGFTVTKIERSK